MRDDAERAVRTEPDRASRAVASYLTTLNDDLRAPLSGMMGVLEVLSASGLDGEQQRMAGMIGRAARMMLTVLDDVRDFSDLEAGSLAVAKVPFCLPALLRDLHDVYAPQAAMKQVSLAVDIASDVPAFIVTDPQRLRQIVDNLFSNAVKFTQRGDVSLHVSISGGGRVLHFDMRDTGIGLTPDVHAHLFRPFTQGEDEAGRFNGTGLGLSISRKLARMLGGDLVAAHPAGEGSVFTLTVPCLVADEASVAPLATPKAAMVKLSARVLVVDDDLTMQWLARRQLEKLGAEAVCVSDGPAALAVLHHQCVDLIMTDCQMPGMDGAALTRAIRAQPHVAHLPVVGLVADINSRQRAQCEACLMTGVAIKPLSAEALASLLMEHVPGCADASAHAAVKFLREPAFDPGLYLNSFHVGDEEGAAWLSDFLRSAGADVAALGAGGAPADVARTAHRLAGAAFAAGAIALGHAARAVEHSAAAARWPELHATLGRELSAAEGAIRRFLASAPQAALLPV